MESTIQIYMRVHNKFGGMRDLAIFRADTRDASWKQERDAGILITRGSNDLIIPVLDLL